MHAPEMGRQIHASWRLFRSRFDTVAENLELAAKARWVAMEPETRRSIRGPHGAASLAR